MTCCRCPGRVSPESPYLTANGKTYRFCSTCAPAAIGHATSTHTMTTEAIQTPFPAMSHGHVFKVYACGEAWHPSWFSFLDELETRELWWNVKPGDVVADVGADFGSYTLSALAQGAAKVYAYSPPHRAARAIECETMFRSAQLNGWEEKLDAMPCGLWSERGHLAVFDGPRPPKFFHGLTVEARDAAEAAIKGAPGICSHFQVFTLDGGHTHRRLDWLKIDAEGAELHVLRGAEATIARCHPTIMLEHHYHIDPNCERDCTAWLTARGYVQDGATRPHGAIAHSLYRWKP
jgi:FkbM family methyltransferase